jgi:hypothetical protein
MGQLNITATRQAQFELRYPSLFNEGRGYSFPCDAQGHVEIGDLSERVRTNYFFARMVAGHDLSTPVVAFVE